MFVVIRSIFRPEVVATLALLTSDPNVKRVHVYGDCAAHRLPRGKITCSAVPSNPLQQVIDSDEELLPYPLTKGGYKKSDYKDDRSRIKWRAQIAMDMFACLGDALEMMYGEDHLVWLENDVWLQTRELLKFMESQRGSFSCWKPDWQYSNMYLGYGVQCLVFDTRTVRIVRQHLLAYGLVQSADWIISDAFPNMPAISASTHKRKRSARLL